jgi:plasmid maintenance system antidote protein VapI
MRLSAYFGCSPQFWLGLQMDHDLWVAAKDKSLSKVKPRAQAA